MSGVKDTNGAGDTFATMYMISLMRGDPSPGATASWAASRAVLLPQSCKPRCAPELIPAGIPAVSDVERVRLAVGGMLGALEEVVGEAVGGEMVGWLGTVPGWKEFVGRWRWLRGKVQERRFVLPVQQQQQWSSGGGVEKGGTPVMQEGVDVADVAEKAAANAAEEATAAIESR